jgi:hypothetical protein
MSFFEPAVLCFKLTCSAKKGRKRVAEDSSSNTIAEAVSKFELKTFHRRSTTQRNDIIDYTLKYTLESLYRVEAELSS